MNRSPSAPVSSEAYRDREIHSPGVRELAGWCLKLYAIRYGLDPLVTGTGGCLARLTREER